MCPPGSAGTWHTLNKCPSSRSQILTRTEPQSQGHASPPSPPPKKTGEISSLPRNPLETNVHIVYFNQDCKIKISINFEE